MPAYEGHGNDLHQLLMHKALATGTCGSRLLVPSSWTAEPDVPGLQPPVTLLGSPEEPEGCPYLVGEGGRLLHRGKVAAPVEFVEVDELGEAALGPAA